MLRRRRNEKLEEAITVTAIEWSEKYRTGLPDIDKDHERLFALVNELHSKADTGADENDLRKIMEELLEYVAYHFSREEGLLQSIGYRDFDDHSSSHKTLEDRLTNYVDRFSADPEGFNTKEFVAFLVSWLDKHIMVVDMAYLKSFQHFRVRV